jgi:hypothetical protein
LQYIFISSTLYGTPGPFRRTIDGADIYKHPEDEKMDKEVETCKWSVGSSLGLNIVISSL